jgi:hypothetical protein
LLLLSLDLLAFSEEAEAAWSDSLNDGCFSEGDTELVAALVSSGIRAFKSIVSFTITLLYMHFPNQILCPAWPLPPVLFLIVINKLKTLYERERFAERGQ